MTSKKRVVIAIDAREDPERATNPFVIANAVLSSDTNLAMFLQSKGVMLAYALPEIERHTEKEPIESTKIVTAAAAVAENASAHNELVCQS